MKRLFVIAPIILTFGCATQLTLEGSSVRLVNDATGCDFVGHELGNQCAQECGIEHRIVPHGLQGTSLRHHIVC